MRIYVYSAAKEDERSHRFSLRLPNKLVFSRLVANIAAKSANKKDKDEEIEEKKSTVTSAQMRMLFKELRKVSHEYKGLVLVDVRSADGDIVKIKL